MTRIYRSSFFRYSLLILAAVLAAVFLFPGIFHQLFSSGPFLPHATCYLQNPQIIWLHVISDTFIGLAYVSISCTLAYLVYKASQHIPFNWVFLAFGIFIVSCGFTHFMEVWTVWQPRYWLAGYVKAITGVASVFTAVALFPLIPRVFRLINSVQASEERKLRLAEAHRELEETNRQLSVRQTELEQANLLLTEQKASLEAANEELEMFSYSVAHDVRAPLRSMQGFATLLQEDYASALGPEGTAHVGRIIEGSDRLARLVQDLLTYSKVSRGTVELHPVRLHTIFEEAAATLDLRNHPRHPHVSFQSSSLSVLGNPTLLGQALVNLLSNAIKYVPADAVPEIFVRVEEEKNTIRVWVEDNGIGIAEADQPKIFRMFERVNPSAQFPGTGIGLAIVKRAVERMAGKVGLVSALGQGSKFWFELPKV